MKKYFFLLLLVAMVLIIQSGYSRAFSVFGVGSQAITRESLENYDNWPYEIRRQCVIEQSRTVMECSRSGYENWAVYQTVKGEGSDEGKDIEMFYRGMIMGNHDCDPPYLVVEDGEITDHWFHINSRSFSATSRSGESANYYCNFLCTGWNCPEGEENKKSVDYGKGSVMCERYLWEDRDWNDMDDITGETSEEVPERMLENRRKFCENMGDECEFRVLSTEEETLKGFTKVVGMVCWYCSCMNISTPKTTMRKNDLKKVGKLLERYEKYDLVMKKLDALSDRVWSYESPAFLSGRKVNLVVYEGDSELVTAGMYFGESIEMEEGAFRDTSIICELDYEDIMSMEDMDGLMATAKENCIGADIFTQIVLTIVKIFV